MSRACGGRGGACSTKAAGSLAGGGCARTSPSMHAQGAAFTVDLAVDLCGKAIPTKVQDHPDRPLFLPLARSSPPRSSHPQVQDHPDRPVDTEKCNVSFEARLIKKMYIRLQHA